jgi:hypothetical protein
MNATIPIRDWIKILCDGFSVGSCCMALLLLFNAPYRHEEKERLA